MTERAPMHTYECPFLAGQEGITCTTSINEQQYHAYCREISQTEKQPNYIQCPAYNTYMQAPVMLMKQIYAKEMDMAHGHARKSQDNV